LNKLLHVGRDWCARRSRQELRAEQIKQRRIGSGTIALETVPLEDEETLIDSIGFDLCNQARFANASFPM
jgi:hypothetical protein